MQRRHSKSHVCAGDPTPAEELLEVAVEEGASAEPRVITDVIFGPHEHDYFYWV